MPYAPLKRSTGPVDEEQGVKRERFIRLVGPVVGVIPVGILLQGIDGITYLIRRVLGFCSHELTLRNSS